jgi:membrane protein
VPPQTHPPASRESSLAGLRPIDHETGRPARRYRRRRTWARWRHRVRRRWRETRCLSQIVWSELFRTKAFDVAGGVAFWALLSMVPLLMTIVALFSFLPVPSLLPQLLGIMAILLPPASLSMVEKMIGHLLEPHGAMLSFGVISYVWSTTGGFTGLITALDIAYDVKVERSWLRDRLQALILTFTSGGLITISLLALIAGPHFVHFLGQLVPIPPPLVRLWPVLRFGTIFVCFVVALEIIYYFGPNMRQRFTSTLPGAVLAIALWFGGSYALAYYLNHWANYSRLYGGMGALIGLMFWMYWTALAIMIGAETNAEIGKRRDSLFRRHLQETYGRRKRDQRRQIPAPATDRTAA